jgi:N-acetyl-D-muramate 6-phosphate phosphatase
MTVMTTPIVLPKPRAILFDFDGTLADTAPDLVEATQHLLDLKGLPRLPYDVLRNTCSSGAKGLLWAALQLSPEDEQFQPMQQVFLEHYRTHSTHNTRLFDGVKPLLSTLSQHNIAWGIVTNKSTDLTVPIVQALLTDIGLPPATVVCGDTTPYAKPHPAPLLKACEDIGIAPQHSWYVGDDRRDVESAVAAGCVPIAVNYGYHNQNDLPHTWGAVGVINHPAALLSDYLHIR